MTSSTKKRIAQIRQGQVPEGYRLTRCGIVPADWTELCLGDIYAERNEPGNENLPLLMVSIHSGVSDGEVDEDQLPKKVKRIVDKTQYKRAVSGDLAFNMMRAWQGAIGTVRTEGMVSPAYIVAVPNDKVDPLFMDYYVKMNRTVQYIHRQSYGVTDFRLRLCWDSFVTIPCVLPPLAEQRKIAKILAAQDRVIELKKKLLEETKRRKKALVKMLMEPAGRKRLEAASPRDPTKRLEAASPRGEAASCRFGDVHWRKMKLGEILCFFHGATIKPLPHGTFPVYGSNGVIGYAEKSLYHNAIIVGRVGACGSVARGVGDFWATDNTIVCDSVKKVADTDYCYHLLKYLKLSKFAGGQAQPLITQSIIRDISTFLPPLAVQRQIVAVLSTADDEIDLMGKELKALELKKKALMQLLLTGMVRVVVKGGAVGKRLPAACESGVKRLEAASPRGRCSNA